MWCQLGTNALVLVSNLKSRCGMCSIENKSRSPLLFVFGTFCSDLRKPWERSLSAAASFKTASLRSSTWKQGKHDADDHTVHSDICGAFLRCCVQPYHVCILVLLCWIFSPFKKTRKVKHNSCWPSHATHFSVYCKYLDADLYHFFYLYSRSLCLRCAASIEDTDYSPLSAPPQQCWVHPPPLTLISE